MASEQQAGTMTLEALYRQRYRDVRRWTSALGGPSVDAEDLAQEVFLVVHRKLHRFHGTDASSWLYAITWRVVQGARRRAWLRRVLLGADRILQEVPDEGLAPDELASRRQRERMLYRLLGSMSEKRRTALILNEIAGHEPEEIARLLGIHPTTARTRLLHARRDFVRLVRSTWAGDPGGTRQGGAS